MSRTGWSATNFERYAGAIVTAAPVTISAWAWTSISSATKQKIAGIFNSASTGDNNSFIIQVDANKISAITGGNSGTATASTTFGPSVNTWFHACGVFASASSRAAYINGGGKGTDATGTTPSGLNRTSIGKRDNAGAAEEFAPAGTGYIADVAIWNVALTDAEVLSLSTGISPLKIRPASLQFYSPMIGEGTGDPNLINAATAMAIQGTLTQGPQPPLIMPRRNIIFP